MSQSTHSFLKLRVITSQKLAVDEEVIEVTVPSLDGDLGILPGHRHLFVALGDGDITYKTSQQSRTLSVHGGYAEIFSDKVLIFTELGRREADSPYEE
jgi:F-type H+-transporting ATPase subunit epsilon